MNQDQIRIFIAAADSGSFSKAEDTLYMSRQAMLKQINHLEAEVGCRLFIRTHSGLTLTPAGKAFYRGAPDLLRKQEELVQQCRRASDEEVIRIGNVEHQVLLGRVTEAFIKLYPNVRIERIAHPNHSGEWRVDHDVIDVGESFISDAMPEHQYAFTELTKSTYVAAMAPDHPLIKQRKRSKKDAAISIHQLADYKTICFPMMLQSSYSNELTDAFQSHPDNLIKRKDVDHQVEAAYACLTQNTILITANPFIHSIKQLVQIPLSEGWKRTYGIIYKPPVSDTVQKYIDLAVSIYRQ